MSMANGATSLGQSIRVPAARQWRNRPHSLRFGAGLGMAKEGGQWPSGAPLWSPPCRALHPSGCELWPPLPPRPHGQTADANTVPSTLLLGFVVRQAAAARKRRWLA